MVSRITPDENRLPLLLKSKPITHKIPPIPTAVDVHEVVLKKTPLIMSLKIGLKPAVNVRPKGESTDVVAPASVETSNRAVQMAIGYRAGGGGKMKSVIPKRRKSVKMMMYHSIKDFVKSLFRPPPYAGAPPPQ